MSRRRSVVLIYSLVGFAALAAVLGSLLLAYLGAQLRSRTFPIAPRADYAWRRLGAKLAQTRHFSGGTRNRDIT